MLGLETGSVEFRGVGFVQSGSYEEPIGRKGRYYDLYMTQYAGLAT